MLALPIPSHLGFEEAAAIPEVFLTAYDALVEQLQLRVGENLLIHAVGSGVGTAAVQLADLMGVTAYGTAGSEEKIERVRLAVEVPYSSHGKVRRVLTEYACAIDEEQFDADVRIIFRIPEEHVDALTEAIGDLTAGRVAPMRFD